MTNLEKNTKKASWLINIAIVLGICILLVAVGIALYDIIGLGYSFDQVTEHLKSICDNLWFWLGTAGATTLGIVGSITVKIISVIENGNQYNEKLNKVLVEAEETKKVYQNALSTYNAALNTKLEQVEDKELTLIEMIDVISSTIYDENVLAALQQLKAKYTKEESTESVGE